MLTGKYPCYLFPVVKIEAYEKYCAENGLHGELWIVDLTENVMLLAHLGFEPDIHKYQRLENKRWFDGKQFPFDQNTSRGLMRFFHRKQFDDIYNLDDVEIDMFARGDFPVLSNALIDYINREFCHISNRLCQMYPNEKDIAKYIPLGAVKKLADLEKECGTLATVHAISTENIIYPDGVEDFLFYDSDDDTFYYICDFAHKNFNDNDIEENTKYGSSILEWNNSHYAN